MEKNIRKRVLTKIDPLSRSKIAQEQNEIVHKKPYTLEIRPGSFWLTRIVILRAVTFIYGVAFLVAYHQNKALIGQNGLLPGDKYLLRIESHLAKDASLWEKVQAAPTLLWLTNYNEDFDHKLQFISIAGLSLSAAVFICGAANIPLMLLIWMLYHSLVSVGQTWYSFGWESQLLETGFLAAFLCPLLSLRSIPKRTPTSFIVIIAFRWIIFRIMLGAGLIKVRGDQCWRDLTCMNYHYETQPVPNPVSYYLHQSPDVIHWAETASNHVIELLAPFLIFMGRRMCIIGGCLQVLFQVVLIISGNLSFLNWLTIVPSLACFDDRSISWLFSSKAGSVKHQVWSIQQEEVSSTAASLKWDNYVRRALNVALGVTIAYLSYPVVLNLISKQQRMNTSFEPFRLVNTYGAFGSITKERTEVIFQGTYSSYPGAVDAEWVEYEFKCKPGRSDRRPCLISPYHYRLDWLMWFAAFQNYQHNPWLVHLAAKMLNNDEVIMDLIELNPFQDKAPPLYVKADHFRYTYTDVGGELAQQGHWWNRSYVGNYLPPVNLQALEAHLKQMGWYSAKSQATGRRKKRV